MKVDGQTPARRTRAEAKEETRRRLLGAAAAEFAAKGFAGASLESIAEDAGYTTGAVYHHFANKDELFVELIKISWSQRIERRARAVAAAVGDEGDDPFEILGRALVASTERDPDVAPLAAEFWLFAVRHREAMPIVAEQLRLEEEAIEPVVSELLGRLGTSGELSPREVATVALVFFDGLSRRRRIDPASVSDDLLERSLRRLFAAP